MLKQMIAIGVLAALMLPARIHAQERPTAQELGAFPVQKARIVEDHQDLRKYARITTTSYSFLKIKANARSAGMGDAYASVGDDLSALFLNPAGITQIGRYEVMASYLNWIVGSQMGEFALAAKTNLAVFAINFAYFATEEYELTTSAQPNGTGQMIRGGNMAVGLTVAKQMTDKLSVGGNMRWVQEDLFLVSYSSFDFDFGTLFYTGYRSSRLGVSMRNLGSEKTVIGQKARLPVAFNLSGAAEVYGYLGDPVSVTLSVEQVYFTDSENKYHFGSEAWIHNRVALRAGYKLGYDNESWSLGFGLRHPFGNERVKLDVAFSRAEALQHYPMRLTLGLGF